jgi:hypothetical protein
MYCTAASAEADAEFNNCGLLLSLGDTQRVGILVGATRAIKI